MGGARSQNNIFPRFYGAFAPPTGNSRKLYLSNCCIPVAQVATRRHLRSAARHQLTVPRHRLSTFGQRAFAVVGPTMINALPDELRDHAVSITFGQSMKTQLSLPISTFSALGVFHVMRYINVRYLLTYLHGIHGKTVSKDIDRKSVSTARGGFILGTATTSADFHIFLGSTPA